MTKSSAAEADHGRFVCRNPAAVLILLAVLLRIGWFMVRADVPLTDPDAYVRLARMLAEGRGFVAADGVSPTAFRPVLFPLVLSVPLAAGLSVRTAVLLCSVMSGILLVVSVVALARAAGLTRRGAVAAGFAAAADPLLLKYSLEPMTENLSAALTAAAVCGFVRYAKICEGTCRADEAQGKAPGANRAALLWGTGAGLLLGLSTLCRPVGLVTCAFLTAVLLAACLRSSGRRKDRSSIGLMRRLLPAVLPAVVAAATVMPWVVRNAVRLHAFVPATTHGGYTLLLGNNSVFYDRVVSGRYRFWDGASLQDWQRSLQERMEREGVLRGGEPAVDRWMYQEALREMQSRPDMVWRAGILRWRRFWAVLPTRRENLSAVLTGTVAVWYGIGLAGILMGLWRVRGTLPTRILWAAVASFLIVHTFYWTNTRMRAPLTGILAVLAVAGWCGRRHSEEHRA